MDIPVILAHGALGAWDELIFLGVAALFLMMMGISWLRSRSAPLDEPDNHEIPTLTPEQRDDHFRLD